jgi:hypothetical protein
MSNFKDTTLKMIMKIIIFLLMNLMINLDDLFPKKKIKVAIFLTMNKLTYF